MMSILPPSNAFLVLTRFATILLRVRIRSYMTNTQLERVNSYTIQFITFFSLLERNEVVANAASIPEAAIDWNEEIERCVCC